MITSKNIIKRIIERELESCKISFPFNRDISPREKTVLKLRKDGYSLSETGKRVGHISRQRVKQIEERAMAKIKKKNDIIDYLAEKIGAVLFTENEIEEIATGWGIDDSVNVTALEFLKHLWKIKKHGKNKSKERE